jgi:uncharacterized protein YecE (DUF72 family)
VGSSGTSRVRIGTSGFLYEHWRGRFYPPSVRGVELEYYAARFDTVELNVTFYRLPSSATFRAWAARVPDGFVYAIKASRYVTHIRRLRDSREAVDLLMERAGELGPHLGPVLLQLPPDLPADLDHLAETLEAFPASVRVAVEPRNESWFSDEFRRLLIDHRAALCLADRRGPVTPVWRTAGWTYVRFHGGQASPRPCYGSQALESWASRVREIAAGDDDSFAFFNNDHQGCALRDAAVFARSLRTAGVDASAVDIGDEVLGR